MLFCSRVCCRFSSTAFSIVAISNFEMSRSRMTKKQKELLINYLEEHKYLVEGRASNSSQLKRYEEKWKELAENLNQVEGARKSVKQWKETLNDFKSNVKRKAKSQHLGATGTGGGPSSGIELKSVEEKLLGLMSPVLISGCPEIIEVGFEEPQEPERLIYTQASTSLVNLEPVDNLEPLDNREPVEMDELNLNNTMNTTISENGKKRKRGKKKANDFLSDIAKKHEEYLQVLAESNSKLAEANARLANALLALAATKKKRSASSVFQLQF